MESFRQAAQSRIVTSAHQINRGRIPDLSRPAGDTDFYFVPAADSEQAVARAVQLVHSRIPKRFGFDPIRDVQVLCPMNRGVVSDEVEPASKSQQARFLMPRRGRATRRERR